MAREAQRGSPRARAVRASAVTLLLAGIFGAGPLPAQHSPLDRYYVVRHVYGAELESRHHALSEDLRAAHAGYDFLVRTSRENVRRQRASRFERGRLDLLAPRRDLLQRLFSVDLDVLAYAGAFAAGQDRGDVPKGTRSPPLVEIGPGEERRATLESAAALWQRLERFDELFDRSAFPALNQAVDGYLSAFERQFGSLVRYFRLQAEYGLLP